VELQQKYAKEMSDERRKGEELKALLDATREEKTKKEKEQVELQQKLAKEVGEERMKGEELKAQLEAVLLAKEQMSRDMAKASKDLKDQLFAYVVSASEKLKAIDGAINVEPTVPSAAADPPLQAEQSSSGKRAVGRPSGVASSDDLGRRLRSSTPSREPASSSDRQLRSSTPSGEPSAKRARSSNRLCSMQKRRPGEE